MFEGGKEGRTLDPFQRKNPVHCFLSLSFRLQAGYFTHMKETGPTAPDWSPYDGVITILNVFLSSSWQKGNEQEVRPVAAQLPGLSLCFQKSTLASCSWSLYCFPFSTYLSIPASDTTLSSYRKWQNLLAGQGPKAGPMVWIIPLFLVMSEREKDALKETHLNSHQRSVTEPDKTSGILFTVQCTTLQSWWLKWPGT